MQVTRVRSLGQEEPLEKRMSTHSSILAGKMLWTEEPGGLQSRGSQRVGHEWATKPTEQHAILSVFRCPHLLPQLRSPSWTRPAGVVRLLFDCPLLGISLTPEQALDLGTCQSFWWISILIYCESADGKPNDLQLLFILTPSWITALSWWKGLCNSMKLWDMPCKATQDGWVTVESSNKTWSTGEGNGNPIQYSCHKNPIKSIIRQKDMTLKDEPPRSEGVQYATGEEWKAILIAPERMMWLGQSGKSTQLWVCLVMKVKSDTIKNNIA